jgi:L,D-transpeptidase ErfK/SrfK
MAGKKTGEGSIVRIISTLMFVVISCNLFQSRALCEEKYGRSITHYPYHSDNLTVIGKPTSYTVNAEDTFLDISRKHELGYNEMAILYPLIDPWMPPAGENIAIPSFWILPTKNRQHLVINIPELRLYFFEKETSCVQTYPVSIGSKGWETPSGSFSITEKRSNPKWYVPKSLQEKYGTAVMPPGPDNPLGKYVMRFSDTSYSIHGTHMPWGVGRLISHGCIRCYPEHIRLIYPQVDLGTKVELIYEPIKFGKKQNRIYVEIHPDVYNRIPDFEQYAAQELKNCHMSHLINPSRYEQAVQARNGMPMDVTLVSDNESRKICERKTDSTGVKPNGEGHLEVSESFEFYPGLSGLGIYYENNE